MRKKLYEKVLWIFKRTRKIYNWFWKKKLGLTKEGSKSYQNAKVCYVCGKRILKNLCKNINYRKARDHCHYTETYRGTTHGICNLKFNVPNEIPVDSNGSNYVYHFIMKELTNLFEGTLASFWENIEN